MSTTIATVSSWRTGVAAAIVMVAVAVALLALKPSAGARLVVRDSFTGRDGLIASERRTGAGTPWRVTSGSLLRHAGRGWTGIPDAQAPDRCSCHTTHSAVFRMVSRARVEGPVRVQFTLWNRRLLVAPGASAHAWDGVNVILRRQSERELYYVAVNRRDGLVQVKKKVAGGTTNGGTYFDVGRPALLSVPYGGPQSVRVELRDLGGKAVQIALTVNGERLLVAVDRGVGGPPIGEPGAVGLRGDNDEFLVDDFKAGPP